ncbi:hypothetical protein [Levilactobacillus cerevisiae]|uniref:hypothetical protein n=1 Tax=Levilactobacillus cerevisiae TaxID=1704076 RepID=UPI000F7A335E|nr:hypothetical protein [Levilactobacillus cerevisiae]
MKLKKILLQLGLLLAFVGVGQFVNLTNATAASLPSGSTAVSLTDGQVYQTKSPGTTVDGGSNYYYTTKTYPTIIGVAANGVDATTHRLTTDTTKIYILFSDQIISNGTSYDAVYPAVMTYGGNSVATSMPKSLGSGKTVNMPNSYQEVDVNLSNLASIFSSGGYPKLYVGLQYKAGQMTSDQIASYYFGTFTRDATFKFSTPVTINSTAGSGSVNSSDTVVSGQATPNGTVTLTGLTDSVTTTADSNGDYSFDLAGKSLKQLGSSSTITVTQSNKLGDSDSVTAKVMDTVPLTITPATSSLTVSPDDWDTYIAGKSSSDIANWLASQAGLSVTKQDSTTPLTTGTDGDGLAFDTTDDTSLTGTIAGGTQDVAINASDTAGDKSTTPATISVTRGAGLLQFTTADMGTMVFGNKDGIAVPSQETLIAPGSYQVGISDTRAAESTWSVTASATDMVASDGSGRTLSGHIVYENGSGTKSPLDGDKPVQVASGTRASGTTTTDIAKNWTQNSNSYTGSTSVPAGVYLDANPDIYAVGGAYGYHGTITWALSDAPGNP